MTPSRTSYGPVAENILDLQMLDGHGDVIFGDEESGGFGGVVCLGRTGIALAQWEGIGEG